MTWRNRKGQYRTKKARRRGISGVQEINPTDRGGGRRVGGPGRDFARDLFGGTVDCAETFIGAPRGRVCADCGVALYRRGRGRVLPCAPDSRTGIGLAQKNGIEAPGVARGAGAVGQLGAAVGLVGGVSLVHLLRRGAARKRPGGGERPAVSDLWLFGHRHFGQAHRRNHPQFVCQMDEPPVFRAGSA